MSRTIKIEFTKPKHDKTAYFSKCIRFLQRTPYSHVRLHWRNSTGRDVIYEASGSQIHFIGELAQPQKPVVIVDSFELDLTEGEYRGLVDLCMKYAGLKYGVLQVWGIFLVYLLKLKKNPFSDGRKSQVCSELVGRFLEEVMGFNLKLDLDIAGPKEIYLALVKELRRENS